jgi:hypothetical protein
VTSVLRIAVLAWATATLLTSPLIAASRCLQCCSASVAEVNATEAGTSTGCETAVGSQRRGHCCARGASQHTAGQDVAKSVSVARPLSIEMPGDPLSGCQNCPKCEASRPAPVDRTVLARSAWPVGEVAWVAPEVSLPVPQNPAAVASLSPERVTYSRPSLQILLCSWLK